MADGKSLSAKWNQSVRLSGITRRWIRSALMIIAAIYLVLSVLGFLVIRSYYIQYVDTKLNAQFTGSVSNFFSSYAKSGSASLEDAARDYIRGYDQKDKIEVWIIDSDGNVLESSSGFAVEKQEIPDYEEALKSKRQRATYSGRNQYGESIRSATFLINDGEDSKSAVRYITSMKEVHKQLILIAFAIFLFFLILMLLILFSGMSFLDSILSPVKEMNEVTKRIAGGDMDARVEPTETRDEIEELAENINAMADEVSSTDKMKNDFISTVSHEMKTPLTAIKGWGETLLSMGDTDPALTKRGLEVIIEETTRLTGVVNDLLDLSKLANGRLTLQYEKIDYLAELDQTIYMFKDRSMREGIELNYNAPHALAPAEGDAGRIDQVFVNILDNAFKYTKQGGTITVAAEVLPPEGDSTKGLLKIYVEDTGCGIAPEDLPKIRRKFYKSNISVRGSGIGLAVVDEIVKMHNGSMDIQSEVNVGTCVTLQFPVEYVTIAPSIETTDPIEGGSSFEQKTT